MSFLIPIKNLGKMLTEFFVCVFVIVCLCVVIFMGLYYLTPNNYIIENFNENDYETTEKIVPDNETKMLFEIKSNSQLKLNINFNYYYKFENIDTNANSDTDTDTDTDTKSNNDTVVVNNDEKHICLIVKNWFKSQDIVMNETELIKISDNAECYILNNSKQNLLIKINSYKKK